MDTNTTENTEKQSLSAKTFWVMVVTVIGKFFAFARTAVCAALFGATWQTDAFNMAQNIIGIISGLTNSLQVTIVPVRTRVLDEKGRKVADEYTSTVMNFTLLLSIGIGVLAFFLAPYIVRIFAPQFSGNAYQMTITMLRIFFPIIAMTTVWSVMSGILNTHGKFTASNLVGIALNVGWMAIPLLMARAWGIYAMVAGYLAGTVMQIVIQWPFLRNVYHYTLSMRCRSSNFINTIKMSIPIFIGTTVSVINQAVDKALASGLVEGSVSALGYALQLIGLVTGIVMVPIVTTVFTSLSQMVQQGQMEDMKSLLIRALSILTIILLPVTLVSIQFNQEIVQIVFFRGEFGQHASDLTCYAFIYYAVGFLAQGFNYALTRCFYALYDSKTPLLISVGAVILNIILNIILVRHMQVGGLALATSISIMMSVIAMMIALRKKIGAMRYLSWVKDLGKICMALAPMAVMTVLIQRYISIGALFSLILTVVMGCIAYWGVLMILKQQDVVSITNKLWRKISIKFTR